MSIIKSSDFLSGSTSGCSKESIPFSSSDWTPVGNQYTLTFDPSDYTEGVVPHVVQVFDDNDNCTDLTAFIDKNQNTITLTVNAVVDGRFDGYISIIFE